MKRDGGRKALDLRPVLLETDPVPHAEGSCLITQGRTKVLITASVEGRVPPFLRDKGLGWVTAEYGMLPRATHERTAREAARGKQQGRTVEIQRLIGRALRGVVDRTRIPDLTFTLDCDVLVADAGTRCASVTGAFVALALAAARLHGEGRIAQNPFREAVAAISVGMSCRGDEKEPRKVLLDLDYPEDSSAEVDLNVIGTSGGRFVEVQGTAEGIPFSEEDLAEMLSAARRGLKKLFACQKDVLDGRLPKGWTLAAPLGTL